MNRARPVFSLCISCGILWVYLYLQFAFGLYGPDVTPWVKSRMKMLKGKNGRDPHMKRRVAKILQPSFSR